MDCRPIITARLIQIQSRQKGTRLRFVRFYIYYLQIINQRKKYDARLNALLSLTGDNISHLARYYYSAGQMTVYRALFLGWEKSTRISSTSLVVVWQHATDWKTFETNYP